MGKKREVELEDGTTGQTKVVEMTNLEWALRYIKLKIQDLVRSLLDMLKPCADYSHCIQIYNNRKTDQCGIILCGTESARLGSMFHASAHVIVQKRITLSMPNTEATTMSMRCSKSRIRLPQFSRCSRTSSQPQNTRSARLSSQIVSSVLVRIQYCH